MGEDDELVKVLALRADNTGCGQYRVMLPAAAVNAVPSLNVSVTTADHLDADAVYAGTQIRIRRVDVPPGVRVVSFQRPTRAALVGAMRWLRERRPDIGIVVELDDDLANLPARHEAFGGLDPRFSPQENVAWLRQALVLADVVTVSTPELARRYGGNRPTFVIRNGVPESMLDTPARTLTGRKRDPDRLLGWAGYTGTHPGDLDVTSGAVHDILTAHPGLRFRNIGPLDGVAKGLWLGEETEDRVEASGWLEPELYRTALSGVDVGIVPLQDTAFNRAKSTLKALEFAAAGVPVIASDLPEFAALRKAGLPLLLAGPKRKDWASSLHRVLRMSDEDLRALANNHRRWVAQHGTVDKRAAEWAHAWKQAASMAQRRTRRAA